MASQEALEDKDWQLRAALEVASDEEQSRIMAADEIGRLKARARRAGSEGRIQSLK